jgi:hypothetical protein
MGLIIAVCLLALGLFGLAVNRDYKFALTMAVAALVVFAIGYLCEDQK